jgi:hypothetical protein
VARGALGGFLESAFDSGGEGEERGREVVVATQALRRAGQARYATLLDCALQILSRPARSGTIGWFDLIASVDPEDELNALEKEAFEINDVLWEVMMKAAASLPGVR